MRKLWFTVGRWAMPAAIAIAAVSSLSTKHQNAIGQAMPGDGPGAPPMGAPDGGAPAGGPDGGHDREGGDHRRGPGGFGGPGGMAGHEPGHEMGRDGGHGGPSWAPTLMPPQMQQVERLRGYLELVDKFSALAKDPTNSGIAAVITAGDLLRPRGADVAIAFYNNILPQVEDPAIQRAIHTQLAEMYRSANKPEQAMNELGFLMTGKLQNIKLPAATTQASK